MSAIRSLLSNSSTLRLPALGSLLYFAGAVALALALIPLASAEGPAVPAGSAPAAGVPEGPSPFASMFPILVMIPIFWFLVIAPQRKKMKEQQEMLNALKHGDEVLTASGILGKITGITDKVVTLEVADNVRVKMLKSQVAQVVKGQIKDLAQ